jgi:mannose-6-phosphate isomerase-like protein (cupin superfamily)
MWQPFSADTSPHQDYPPIGGWRATPAPVHVRGMSQPTPHPEQPLGAIVLGPGEGRRIPGPEGLVVKAGAEHTDASIAVLEATSQPGFGAPAHVHHECEELFYVLEGRFEFLLGERLVEAGPGSFVLVPRGTVHAPRVISAEPGKMPIMFAPGGAERFFDDFAALVDELGGPPAHDDPRVEALVRASGSELVGPPR